MKWFYASTLIWYNTHTQKKTQHAQGPGVDLELIWGQYTDLGGPNSRKVEKEKVTFCIKIKKLPSASLVSKLKIELEHISTVKRKQNDNSTLLFLCFCQFLDKKVKTSCPELPRKQLDQLEQHCGCISTFYVVVEFVLPLFPVILCWTEPN